METNPFKKLRKYAQHKDYCPAGRTHMCVCGHPLNNHFDFNSEGIKRPCAHCPKGKCPGFTVGACVCGLTKLLKALRGNA